MYVIAAILIVFVITLLVSFARFAYTAVIRGTPVTRLGRAYQHTERMTRSTTAAPSDKTAAAIAETTPRVAERSCERSAQIEPHEDPRNGADELVGTTA